jgi:RNA polymerase sigma-70 factor (ECF subfamily)
VVTPQLSVADPSLGPPPDDDNALAAALMRGDRAALGRLYDRHAPVLLALGFRILGDRGRAEDVLHDVFLEAWNHAADFDPARGTMRAWLATRMRSRALDRRTALLRQERLAEEAGHHADVVQPGAETGLDAGAAMDRGRVHGFVSGMPVELGQVIELAYFQGLSASETARQLQIPIGTVKSRMARALALLRHDLGDAGGSQ